MPGFEGQEEVKQEQDLSNVVALKPYISFWVKDVETGGGIKRVLLRKDNKSPFIKIYKGEYLQLVEKAIPNAYQKEKKSIYEKNNGDQKGIDYYMKYLDDKNTKKMLCLKNNQEKYMNCISETAETCSAQPDMMQETIRMSAKVMGELLLNTRCTPLNLPCLNYAKKIIPNGVQLAGSGASQVLKKNICTNRSSTISILITYIIFSSIRRKLKGFPINRHILYRKMNPYS